MITQVNLDQIYKSTSTGSIISDDGTEAVWILPSGTANHLWGRKNGTGTVPILLGSNLNFDTLTNTLSALASGYTTIKDEGVTLTSRNTLNFIGVGIAATDNGIGASTDITLDATLDSLASFNTNGFLVQTAADTFAGRTITGTANRITITNGDGVSGNPTIDIHSSYVGQNTITTLGTITTGVWNGTTIEPTFGGTGINSYVTGDTLYASSTNTLSKLAIGTTGNFYRVASGIPTWTTAASTDLSDSSNIAKLNANQTFTGNNTYNNNVVVNATPSGNNDVVTLGFLQSYTVGMSFRAVEAATTGALTITGRTSTTLNVGGTSFTIDGRTFINGEYVLIKNGTSGVAGAGNADNGPYIVSGVGTSIVLTRAAYMDDATEVDGMMFIIRDGSTNGGTIWNTVSEVVTLGTDPIIFNQIQTSGTLTGTGIANRIAYWTGANNVSYSNNFFLDGSQIAFGTSTPATNTIMTTKGTGTTSGTAGYKHLDSTGATLFVIQDDGTIGVGSTFPMSISNTGFSRNGSISITPSSGNDINLYNGNGGTIYFGAGYNWTNTTGNRNIAVSAPLIVPTSGSATFTLMSLEPSINQTGGANGKVTALKITPTVTAANDFRGIEITSPSSHYSIYSVSGKIRFDFGSDATGDIPYRLSTGELGRLAIGTSSQVLIGGTTPSWGSIPYTVVRAYVTGSTSSTFDLDSGTAVTDKDGNNIVFTVPTDLDKVFIYRNGVLQSISGTVTRDYTLNSGTGILTLSTALASNENLLICKIV